MWLNWDQFQWDSCDCACIQECSSNAKTYMHLLACPWVRWCKKTHGHACFTHSTYWLQAAARVWQWKNIIRWQWLQEPPNYYFKSHFRKVIWLLDTKAGAVEQEAEESEEGWNKQASNDWHTLTHFFSLIHCHIFFRTCCVVSVCVFCGICVSLWCV